MRYRLLATLAFIGFLASLVVHIAAWFGIAPPGGEIVFLLHIGIFFLWIPLVILSNRTKPLNAGKNNVDYLLAELPKWAGKALGILGLYLAVNFIYFMYCTSKYPTHGVPPWLVLRGFSGHWMFFYGASVAGFVGLDRLSQKQKNQIR